MALTDQKKRFADRYFETLNGKQSAIYAGYSEATAKQIAYNLLQEDEVDEYLTELKSIEAEKHGITKEKWLGELAALGFSNVQDFISEGNRIKDISKLPEVKAKAVSSIKRTEIVGDGWDKTTVEFKLHDKLNALEKIGRHFDFYKEDSSNKPQTTTIINLGKGVDPNAETTT